MERSRCIRRDEVSSSAANTVGGRASQRDNVGRGEERQRVYCLISLLPPQVSVSLAATESQLHPT